MEKNKAKKRLDLIDALNRLDDLADKALDDNGKTIYSERYAGDYNLLKEFIDNQLK